MANSAKLVKFQQDECNEDDKELQAELENLVHQIIENDSKMLPKALEDLKQLIQKSIKSSILTVPKALKYLSPYYNDLKQQYELMKDRLLKQELSDIISILSLMVPPTINDKQAKKYDCLHYCLQGSGNLLQPNWYINEYIRQLEYEIMQIWYDSKTNREQLLPLIKEILKSNSANNDHIHTCDLLTEINQMELFDNYVTKDNYYGITIYLKNCSKYVDSYELIQIQNLLFEIYKKFQDSCHALIVAIQMNDTKKVENLFEIFQNDRCILYQMAFICARHLYQFNLPKKIDDDKIRLILDNNYLNQFYLEFGHDLDVLEPKTPQDIYKNSTNNQNDICSARENLAASFVNGFVNVGFGTDKLLTNKNSNNWIYKNKDYGIMSTVASIGLLYLWDIDNGLLEIDKYLYTNDKFVKYGAILAIGIINCRIKNECDPVLALLNDYIGDDDDDVVISAIFGIGLAYARTNRLDIIDLLLSNIEKYRNNWKIFSTTSLMCGLISLGYKNDKLIKTVTNKMMESNDSETTKSPFSLLTILGVCLCYYGSKELIETEFKEPIKSIFDIVLKMCSYATSGDVLIIQQLLQIIEKPVNDNDNNKNNNNTDELLNKSLSILAIVIIVQNDDIGIEMVQRILTQISNYTTNDITIIRKTIPLAICLLSIGNPQLNLITILLKYCHDINDEIACNGIFSLGIIGAGTNNPRLLKILRQLSIYHESHQHQRHRDTFELLMMMIRIVHGLICMGKGTVTLNPRHTDQQLYDPLSIIGILIPMFILLSDKSPSYLLLKAHYFLFTLALSIQPKWLLILNEDLQQLHMNVRIGECIDIVGKVGMCSPKTIIGVQQQTTPILLNANEKVELISDNCNEITNTNLILDGICVLREEKKQTDNGML